MEMVTVGDFLDRIAGIEDDFARYCTEVRDKTSDNDVRLLTYFLARHRHHLHHALEGMDPQVLKEIRIVPLAQSAARIPGSLPPEDLRPEDIRGPDLIRTAITYDTQLAAQYARFLDLPLDETGKGLFKTLITVEQRDIKMLNKMLAIQYF